MPAIDPTQVLRSASEDRTRPVMVVTLHLAVVNRGRDSQREACCPLLVFAGELSWDHGIGWQSLRTEPRRGRIRTACPPSRVEMAALTKDEVAQKTFRGSFFRVKSLPEWTSATGDAEAISPPVYLGLNLGLCFGRRCDLAASNETAIQHD